MSGQGRDSGRLAARLAGPMLLVLAVLGGCVSTPSASDHARVLLDDRASADAIARNLVLALVQLPAFDPRMTTIQVGALDSAFERTVVARLVDAGYGLQEVSGDQGLNFVRVRAADVESEEGRWATVRLSVGGVVLERDFEREDGDVVARSALRVEGTDPVAVVLDDSDLAATRASADAVVFVSPGALSSATSASGARPEGIAVALGEPARRPASSPAASSTRPNLAGRMSTYARVFADYRTERSAVLIFPHDSARLDGKNARIVGEFAAALNPATDVIGLIGCSFGDSAVEGGNAALANARAEAVRSALLEAGVEAAGIRDFASWSARYHKHLPRRGVVLELQRSARPGSDSTPLAGAPSS